MLTLPARHVAGVRCHVGYRCGHRAIPVTSRKSPAPPTMIVEPGVDNKLLAADTTLIYACSFARTLSNILLDPSFPGWLAPIRSDPDTLWATLNLAGLWATLWILAGVALQAFSPGVDAESTQAVGPAGALRTFAAAGLCWLIVSGTLTAVSEVAFTPLQLTASNIEAAAGFGIVLIAWRSLLADITLR